MMVIEYPSGLVIVFLYFKFGKFQYVNRLPLTIIHI